MFRKRNGRPWKSGHPQYRMKLACERAKLAVCGFHVSRHSFASWLVQDGVPLKTVAALLGHTSTVMIEWHYGHLSPDQTAKAVERLPTLRLSRRSRLNGLRDYGMSARAAP
jgi:integrase